MHRTSLDRRQRVRHRTCGVVLAVDAKLKCGAGTHAGDDAVDSARQHPAVGVAQHANLGTCISGNFEQRHAVLGIALVAIEEMLTVDEHSTAVGNQVAHGVANHREVLIKRRMECVADMADVTLCNQRDDGGLGSQQGSDLLVVLDVDAGLARCTERNKQCVLKFDFVASASKELGVLGHRTGPAALDEADTQRVQQSGNRKFVRDGV